MNKNSWLYRFNKRFQNARAVIRQIKNGEWEFRFNELVGHCCTAHRNGRELWVSNGGFFTDVDRSNAFGLLFRHYVWWAAAWSARLKADKKYKLGKKSPIPDLVE